MVLLQFPGRRMVTPGFEVTDSTSNPSVKLRTPMIGVKSSSFFLLLLKELKLTCLFSWFWPNVNYCNVLKCVKEQMNVAWLVSTRIKIAF
jgi:hypothetical protein